MRGRHERGIDCPPTRWQRFTDKLFRVITPTRAIVIRDIAMVTTITLLFMTIAFILYDRREKEIELNSRIRQLACSLVAPFPSRYAFIAEIRTTYHCARYNPAVGKALLGTPHPTITIVPPRPAPPTRTVTVAPPGHPSHLGGANRPSVAPPPLSAAPPVRTMAFRPAPSATPVPVRSPQMPSPARTPHRRPTRPHPKKTHHSHPPKKNRRHKPPMPPGLPIPLPVPVPLPSCVISALGVCL